MKDQINTAREGIKAALEAEVFVDKPVRRALLDSLAALAQLEAMVGEQKPVAYLTRDEDGDKAMLFFDRTEAATYCEEGVEPEALVLAFAAQVAQQHVPEADCGNIKAQQPQAPTESVLIDGIAYDTPAPVAAELLRLHLKLKQPQAEAVQACGHSMSLLLRSAESNAPLYCEACDDKSGRHDAERRETELLDANRRLQEKIGSADALKLHAVEELCQLGYTVKDDELFPPDHLHKLMEAAGHPLAVRKGGA